MRRAAAVRGVAADAAPSSFSALAAG